MNRGPAAQSGPIHHTSQIVRPCHRTSYDRIGGRELIFGKQRSEGAGTKIRAVGVQVETVNIKWMFQNAGTCAWDANYTLTFISGDPMSGVATSIDTSMAPGAQAELSVSLTAPSTAGNYTGYWQLADDSGATFGAEVYVLIDVNEDATATPTVTPEVPTTVSTTAAPPTVVATTAVPPTAAATTTVPPTTVPTTAAPPTANAIPTAVPPTPVPTAS